MCPELSGFVMLMAVRGTSPLFSFSSDRIWHLSQSSAHLLPFLQIAYLLFFFDVYYYIFKVLGSFKDNGYNFKNMNLCHRIYYQINSKPLNVIYSAIKIFLTQHNLGRIF